MAFSVLSRLVPVLGAKYPKVARFIGTGIQRAVFSYAQQRRNSMATPKLMQLIEPDARKVFPDFIEELGFRLTPVSSDRERDRMASREGVALWEALQNEQNWRKREQAEQQ